MRLLLESFERSFATLHDRSLDLLVKVDEADLYRSPRLLERSMTAFSVGEYLLRSAAVVEQTFGGITTRLWDDPFEWTLPEKLSDKKAVCDYLAEVKATSAKAFLSFTSDDDLTRHVPAPEKLRPIGELLLESIARAEHFQGRAFALFQVLSDERLPRL